MSGKMHRALALATLLAFSLGAGNAEARRTGGKRSEHIDMVVIHSTGGPTCDAASGKPIWVPAGTMADDMREIEAHPVLGIHYMIARDGTLRSSVPENEIAHHVYHYSGRSLAIELVNDGDGRDPFPPAQLDALVKLLREITQRYGISRDHIVRHSDVDHGHMSCDKSRRRKVDPGSAFPYRVVLDRVYDGQRKTVTTGAGHG